METRREQLDSDARPAVQEVVDRVRAARERSVREDVSAILASVRLLGDAALLELARRHDTSPRRGVRGVPPTPLWASPADADMQARQQECLAALAPAERHALEVARANIGEVARAWRPAAATVELDAGHRVRLDEVPVRRAAICVPGGQAPYVSTVLMGVETARAAGVEEVVVCTPAGEDGTIHPALLATFALVGDLEILCAGGAHAVAALAHGTAAVAPVDIIAGPGGDYVQEAKRQVTGHVGVDGYAGPSELLLIVDGVDDLAALALDLAAQAEHGRHSTVVAAAADDAIIGQLERLLAAHAPASEDFATCTLLSVPDLRVAEAFADAMAPEHVQLAGPGAEELAGRLRTAGCVFVGGAAGTAFGDYVAGSNHALPTGGAARFASVLNPGHFLRRRSTVTISPASATALAGDGAVIAELEGFSYHARSMLARRDPRAAEAPSAAAVRWTIDHEPFTARLLAGDREVGSAHYEVVDVPGDPLGRVILWERSVSFSTAHRAAGHERAALRMALASVAPTQSIGWLGGRGERQAGGNRARSDAPLLLPGRGGEAPDDARALAAVAGRGEGDTDVWLVPFWSTGERAVAFRLPYSIAEVVAPPDAREWAQAIAVYRAVFEAPPYREVWDEAEAAEALGADQRLFLARHSERGVVGFGALRELAGALPAGVVERLVARDGTGRPWEDAMMISELGVSPAEQGSGLGGALLRRLVAEAAGEAPVVLVTHAANEPSITLYRRHGFRLADVAPRPVWARRVGGRWALDARIVMVR